MAMLKHPQEKKFNELALSELVALINKWPMPKKVELLQSILRSFDTEEATGPDFEQRKKHLDLLWNLLPEDMPELTDEQLDEMKIRWRLEKYA